MKVINAALEVERLRKELSDSEARHKLSLDNWGREQATFNSKVYKLRRVLLICREIRKANIPSGLKNLESLLDEEVDRVLDLTK